VLKNRRRLVTLLIVLGDVVLINLAFALAYWLRYGLELGGPVEAADYVPYRVYLPLAAIATVLFIIAYRLEGLYNFNRGRAWYEDMYAIVNGTTTGTVVMIVLAYFARSLSYSRGIFVYVAICVVAILSLSRLVQGAIWARLRQRGLGVQRVLIVGAGEVGRAVMRSIVAQPGLGYHVVGYVDDNPEKGHSEIGRFKGLGELDNLPRIVEEEAVDEVIITLPWMYHRKILSIVRECERRQVRATIVPDLFQIALSHVSVENVGGIPMISLREVSLGRWNRILKRAVDFTFALVGLIVLAPLMALIAVAIKLDSPGPVLFKQVRVGQGGRRFILYKFRSMRVGAEEEQKKLEAFNEARGPIFKMRNDPRVTRIGRILRRTSLDELPQLYNVLRGEMSLIGPRPPLPSEVAQYREWHKRRLEVAPGITGLWQVSGRSDLTFDEMALLDIYYIENWSLTLDALIFLRTIPRVIFGNGAY